MVEVFKTNVIDPEQADLVIREICNLFPHYKVNFDMEDCDKILRVETDQVFIDADEVIRLLAISGVQSEVLPDIIVSKV
ncbi:hypothetical protein JKA74_08930 [Marivirga sp. S37H4]|uniref:Uncharacterized protein n=1 Tax=Marivirga aurantiaca TaxID=2802615 RepID=A0A934WYK0_9BACT|nr:hypothetical protein [Marivirga aurantiaca]MBK6265160.1 hypothetical protein [Marivirga aurantiaca]